MTRVVLREATPRQAILAVLRASSWSTPSSEKAVASNEITATPWRADGITTDSSRAWEVRLHDKASEHLANEKTDLERERTKLSVSAAAATENQNRLAAISTRIAEIDTSLSRGAARLRDDVLKTLGRRVIDDGEQVIDASLRGALLIEFSTPERPERNEIETLLNRIRNENPAVIDLRPMKRNAGYGLALSVTLDGGQTEEALVRELQIAIKRAAARPPATSLGAETEFVGLRKGSALGLELAILEDPVVTYISPISRAVNVITGLFGKVPAAERRLDAIARLLQSAQPHSHVRVIAGRKEKTLMATTLLESSAAEAALPDDAITRRLRVLLTTSENQAIASARLLYDHVDNAAAVQRITVARPVIASSYAPLHYDYLSGYLWMFLMCVIGISLTVIFNRLEAKGVVRKRGLEESQAS
jgi:hypothetical protein